MDKKEALFVKNAAILQQEEMEIARSMEAYVSLLQKEAKKEPAVAREKARKALARTGVTTTSGNLKKKIVSWE